jgi:hypothetical protein
MREGRRGSLKPLAKIEKRKTRNVPKNRFVPTDRRPPLSITDHPRIQNASKAIFASSVEDLSRIKKRLSSATVGAGHSRPRASPRALPGPLRIQGRQHVHSKRARWDGGRGASRRRSTTSHLFVATSQPCTFASRESCGRPALRFRTPLTPPFFRDSNHLPFPTAHGRD